MSFTHLHVHSEYSLLDGFARIPDLVGRTRELGMEALALTDHGVMYGAIQFYEECLKQGVKPIIGLEAYVARGDHRSKTPNDKGSYHITLLAKNETGYKNLIKLTTAAHLEGYYYKPRIDRALLEKHSEGLIVLSGCPNGEMARAVREDRWEDAVATVNWYRERFEHFYIEIQEHGIPEMVDLLKHSVKLARELDIPMVATNDSHYVRKSDSYPHDVLLCIGMNCSVHDEKRMRYHGDSFFVKSPQEMVELFPEFPDAVANTLKVADLVDIKLEFNRLHLPDPGIPDGKDPDDYLAELCWKGLEQRLGPNREAKYDDRLRHELEVIKQMEFAKYFLVVWDFTKYARDRKFAIGVRGSAAGSIVLWCLGITDIDPIEENLVFERFLNIERKEMPDIDMDFADDRRDEVIEYVVNKYGRDHVAQIITFGTLGAKAAIRDVGRSLGMSYGEVDRVARLIPQTLHMTIDRAMEEIPELANLYKADQQVRHLIDTAKQLEGISRHASTHAAGVVISKEPLTNYVPLQRASKSEDAGVVTQYPAETLAKIGLLKMDFLGLINLRILSHACELIKQTRGEEIDLLKLPQNDKKTFEMLGQGETTGVFQLESSGMRRYIKELKPNSVRELAAMIALYRPGPMAHIPKYIDNKFGRSEITYLHPALEPILRDTYGIIVYQDQVLFIVRAIAGFSLGKADIFRKAMGKKKKELVAQQREDFMKGAEENGVSREVAEQIFELIEPFAGYAFNKAHATCYAQVAYQTAYLKANYPAEYMAAVLSAHMGQNEKIAADVTECQRLGVEVLPLDINKSGVGFTIENTEHGQAVRFGLAAVKNVGEGAVESIIAERERGGPFASIDDFIRRIDTRTVNKRVLESLIKAGALDSFAPRGALLQSLDRLVAAAQEQQRLRESGQSTMFDLLGEQIPVSMPTIEVSGEEEDLRTLLAWEKDLIGIYLSEHPFKRAARTLAGVVSATLGELDQEWLGQTVTIAGIVQNLRVLMTKDKRQFASMQIEDLEGSIEVTAWPETYERCKEAIVQDAIVIVTGKVKPRDDRLQVVCDDIRTFSENDAPLPAAVRPAAPVTSATDEMVDTVPARRSTPAIWIDDDSVPDIVHSQPRLVVITLPRGDDEAADCARLRRLFATLTEFPGQDAVRVRIPTTGGTAVIEKPGLTVAYGQRLDRHLAEILGPSRVHVEQLSAAS